MILELLIDLFFGFIDLLLSLIPNINISGDILNGISTLGQYVGYADTIVNLNVAISCVLLIIAVDNISFFVKIFNFIMRKIPFIS